ncbi:hypothetical protein RRG08_027396 [Elysia crispata]|uniref:Uncharacterized protein n=1 Tax=Elysia crispata TaxID=231223 RepID=A0AAE0YEZ5_9GAST|nr:hypothetical protein RRG08_027396 [Elysia crispata]
MVVSTSWLLSWLCVLFVVAVGRRIVGAVYALWLGWFLGWTFNLAGLEVETCRIVHNLRTPDPRLKMKLCRKGDCRKQTSTTCEPLKTSAMNLRVMRKESRDLL